MAESGPSIACASAVAFPLPVAISRARFDFRIVPIPIVIPKEEAQKLLDVDMTDMAGRSGMVGARFNEVRRNFHGVEPRGQ